MTIVDSDTHRTGIPNWLTPHSVRRASLSQFSGAGHIFSSEDAESEGGRNKGTKMNVEETQNNVVTLKFWPLWFADWQFTRLGWLIFLSAGWCPPVLVVGASERTIVRGSKQKVLYFELDCMHCLHELIATHKGQRWSYSCCIFCRLTRSSMLKCLLKTMRVHWCYIQWLASKTG